ncbi:hypothetical protein FHG87_020122 [Trinorchestia longiramus]|nr:hypothetical protein FHG87_020122 [Trinorchestia longiramus]
MLARLSEKRPALVNRRGPVLLHDNARAHVARMTVQKLTELGYEALPHPPYSPDLSSTDHHLFKHLITFLMLKRLGLNKRGTRAQVCMWGCVAEGVHLRKQAKSCEQTVYCNYKR